MLVILSQKIDTESEYEDQLFQTYHYPSRYRKQLHSGDVFVYYQGNRYDRSQRYYFGVGRIGEINQLDDDNYYAQLIDCRKFKKHIPIYLPDGGYIEQLGYDSVRKSINPPWQSSVRPLSQDAFNYILKAAGIQFISDPLSSADELKEKLKDAVRDFYVGQDDGAILRIESISKAIAQIKGLSVECDNDRDPECGLQADTKVQSLRVNQLLEYCQTMKMSYSYKPVLIMSLFQPENTSGKISIQEATQFFRRYYADRKSKGLCVEKKRCVYQKDDVTDRQIAENIIANPVHALAGSGFFLYDPETQEFSVLPNIQKEIDSKIKSEILRICKGKLNSYYGEEK